MALLNLPYELKRDNIEVVGYFPIFPGNTLRLEKLVVLSKCLETLLNPLKEASEIGAVWAVQNQDKYRFFPRVISYIADDPEIRDILCIAGHGSAVPCERCMVGNEELGVYQKEAVPRVATQTKSTVENVLQRMLLPSSDADAFTYSKASNACKAHGLMPVLSGLFTLFGDYMTNGASNYHQIFGYDSLHNDDLGLIPDLVRCACEWIKEKWSNKNVSKDGYKKVFKAMNSMLKLIPRSEQLVLPSNEYFPDQPHAQAIEHRSVLQVLPHIFNEVLKMLRPTAGRRQDEVEEAIKEGEDVLWAIISYAYAYGKCQRRNNVNYFFEGELDGDGTNPMSIQFAINTANDLFMKYLARFLPSEGNTIKRHRWIAHFVQTVRLLGHPRNYSSQLFEAQHATDKRLYRSSARRPKTLISGIIRHRNIAELFTMPPLQRMIDSRVSSREAAASSGNNTLVKTGIPISIQDLKKTDASFDGDQKAMLEARPDLKEIPTLLHECITGSYISLYAEIPNRLPSWDDTILVVNSGTILANSVPGSDGNIMLQTIRATHNYNGKPQYTTCEVCVTRRRGITANQQPHVPCEVRALFTATVDGRAMPFAFIEEFKSARPDQSNDILAQNGCLLLEKKKEMPSRYRVVPLSEVVRRLDIVPPLGEKSTLYRLNTLQWNPLRSPAQVMQDLERAKRRRVGYGGGDAGMIPTEMPGPSSQNAETS